MVKIWPEHIQCRLPEVNEELLTRTRDVIRELEAQGRNTLVWVDSAVIPPDVTRPEDDTLPEPTWWDQSNWRCETGMCFAGYAARVAGYEWGFNLGSRYMAYVLVGQEELAAISGENDAERPHALPPYRFSPLKTPDGRWTAHVADVMQYRLGLTRGEADELFARANDHAELISRCVDEILEGCYR